jgi:hypothetical protein
VNVKRAVAAAAGVIGTLILVAAVGTGYLTGHHSSARPGAATVAHPTAITQSGTASTAAPVKATLDAFIYGDSLGATGIFGDGFGVWVGTTTPGDGTATTGGGTSDTGGATVGTTPGDGASGVVTLEIYGD